MLLDTNVVSSLMRDPRGRIRQQIEERANGVAAISIVTLAEIRYGVEKVASNRLNAALEALLQYLPVLPIEEPVDRSYGRIRTELELSGRPIGPNDLFIAAHALTLDLILITANIREFSRVPGLKVENWLD